MPNHNGDDYTPTISKVLGDRIREARRELQMTQNELAGNDYSISYISAVERNKIRPSLRALAFLASKLNVQLSDLLAGNQDEFGEAATVVAASESDLQDTLAQCQMALAAHQPQSVVGRLEALRDSTTLPSLRTQINLLLGEAYIALGKGVEAKEVLEHNLVLTKDVDPVTQEYSRNLLGTAYNRMAMHMLAAECHRQCLEAIESGITRDPSFTLSVLHNLGNDYLLLGQFDEAIGLFKQASLLGQRLQTPQATAQLYWEISQRYRSDGKIAESQRFADMAAEHLRAAANRHIFAHVQSNLGLAYAEQGQNDDAERTLETARDLAERNGDAQGRSMALSSLSRVQLARGAKREALAAAQHALTAAEAGEDRDALGRAHLALGESLAANNKNAEADTHFSTGLQLLQDSGSPAELARAYERYSSLLEQRGDVKQALEYMKRARSGATR